MNEVYIEKLLSLVKQQIITTEQIKVDEYRNEVTKRLNPIHVNEESTATNESTDISSTPVEGNSQSIPNKE